VTDRMNLSHASTTNTGPTLLHLSRTAGLFRGSCLGGVFSSLGVCAVLFGALEQIRSTYPSGAVKWLLFVAKFVA